MDDTISRDDTTRCDDRFADDKTRCDDRFADDTTGRDDTTRCDDRFADDTTGRDDNLRLMKASRRDYSPNAAFVASSMQGSTIFSSSSERALTSE